MNVSVDGHLRRLRERVERMGAEGSRPQDLMELLLYYALPRRDTKEQAFAIMERFGSIRGVLEAKESELAAVEGVGRRTAHWLRLLSEATNAYSDIESEDRQRVNNVYRAQMYFSGFFEKCDYPEVWQCSLNTGGRLLSTAMMANNASWAESEYLREALAEAITSRAHSVVIGQFSLIPGAQFEDYDVKNTTRYAVTLAAAGIQLLDHMLICPDGVRSMFALGLMERAHGMTGVNTLRENYLAETDDIDGYESY